MKTPLALLAALALSPVGAAEPWEDPAVNEINRLPARTFSVPCQTEELACDMAQDLEEKTASRWIISLAGTWDFRWKPSTATADWTKTGTIAVPGCWQLQGAYDPPLYTNVRYPIEPDAPRVTKAPADTNWTAQVCRNPVALYTTGFKRPWRWWFRRTILRFEGVSSAFRVRVNGRDVGYAEDSRLPSEFDVTPYLKVFGRNTLEVEVYKHSDGTYLEDQDFWRLSGIFRNVYLVSERKDAPFDLVVETTLSDDLKSGRFVVRDEKGTVLKERDVPAVQLWSPERPCVYITPIENKWGWWIFGGTDYRAVSFGFRKVEIRDSVLYLNGKRLLVKGVNRHEMSPSAGYAVTTDDMRRDIDLLKAFNVNAVRTCHYPDAPEWYGLCDFAGLLVVCEANVESHGYCIYSGTNSLSFRKDYEASHVERGVRMVRTYRNHPSICIWSMGNESGNGPNFKAEYRAMRALDPTRPIQYEGYCGLRMTDESRAKKCLAGDEADFTDIECPMYSTPAECEAYVKNAPKKPFVLCEYTHAMGNSNGGVREYWDLAERYPSFQGGFVWDFADQALWKTDANGKWLAYGGDFGDRPNDGNFNCNGLFDALRVPHPGAFELKHAYQDIRCTAFDFATGTVTVRNDFLFKDLDEYTCFWQSLNADGSEAAHGSFGLGRLAAGATGTFALKKFSGETVALRFLDEDEACVAWDSFAKPFAPAKPAAGAPAAPPVALRLNFWRAPTDNDNGWNMSGVCKVWKDATETQKLPAGVTSDLKTSKLANGATLVDWTLTVPEGLPPIPRVGLTFTLPKNGTVEYFGLGPWENYSDRASGSILGVYRASVFLATGLADPRSGAVDYPDDRLNPDNYVRPGEQGYRTGCRWMKIGPRKITAVSAPFGFNVWPYPQATLEGKRHQWELREGTELTVNVDAAQMGVGGDNSWGARPHAPYMLGAGTYRLAFTME